MSNKLVLGWKANRRLEPKYWVRGRPVAGEQSDNDLVLVPAQEAAHNTAVIAQSGSGKSFFLGRLIEELVLRTRGRFIILDSNADFRKFSQVVEPNRWPNAKYDSVKKRGFLPHENRRENFADAWQQVRMRIIGGAK